jgi:hypothetical protein
MNLKRIILPCLGGLALLAAPAARAWTYNNGDLLLIFRETGHNNVEFDLGSVSNYLGYPNGYTNVVAGWNFNVVTTNYSLTNSAVQFALIASTSTTATNRTVWLSDSQPLFAVNDIGSASWGSGLAVPINTIGQGGQSDPAAPAGTNYDVLANTSPYAFDYITSINGSTPAAIPYLGGGSPITFEVTAATPNTVLFYAIQPSSVTPKPAATLIGSFTLFANGTLVFQAGPLLDTPTITSVAASNSISTLTFTTKAAVKYRLIYSPLLSNSRSNWTILPNPVAGTGTPGTAYDNSATVPQRFYAVQSYP